MRLEKSKSISFKSFKVDDKGKSFLNYLTRETSKDAIPVVNDMFAKFKTNMDEYAYTLDFCSKTKGIDILFTERASNATDWESVPALILKREDKEISEPLYLFKLTPYPYKGAIGFPKLDISKVKARSAFLLAESKKWFNKNLRAILDYKEVKQ